MRPSRKTPKHVQIRRFAAAWLINAPNGGPRPRLGTDMTPRALRRAWQIRRQLECEARHNLTMRLAALQCTGLPDYLERVEFLAQSELMMLIQIFRGHRTRPKAHGMSLHQQISEKRETLIKVVHRRNALGPSDLGETMLDAAARVSRPAASEPADDLAIPIGRDGRPTHAIIHVAGDLKPSSSHDKRAERDSFRLSIAKPLKIAGPRDEHAVDELFAALYAEAPWMQQPIEFLWRSARERVNDPAGFCMPPVLLIGPPGCGKTHVARRLGELSGCDPLKIDMTAASSTGMIAGVEYVWNSAHPGGPLRHIEARRIANPVVVLDEIEKRSVHRGVGDPVEALLPMLQPETAREIYNPWVQATVDMSRISWVLLANDCDRLPAPLLDRVRTFWVELPRGPDLRTLVGNALGGLAEREIVEIAAQEIERGRMSMRGLQRIRDDIERAARRPMLN